MSFCTKCGADVPEGSSFCIQCGIPLAESAPPDPPEREAVIPVQSELEGARIEDSRRFTPSTPGGPFCRFCKGPLDLDGEYCEQCGAPVAEAAPGAKARPRPLPLPELSPRPPAPSTPPQSRVQTQILVADSPRPFNPQVPTEPPRTKLPQVAPRAEGSPVFAPHQEEADSGTRPLTVVSPRSSPRVPPLTMIFEPKQSSGADAPKVNNALPRVPASASVLRVGSKSGLPTQSEPIR